jgi:hypothetical protein
MPPVSPVEAQAPRTVNEPVGPGPNGKEQEEAQRINLLSEVETPLEPPSARTDGHPVEPGSTLFEQDDVSLSRAQVHLDKPNTDIQPGQVYPIPSQKRQDRTEAGGHGALRNSVYFG